MAAADNPYFIAPANAMQALMAGYQGYDRSQAAAKQAELQAGRQDAMAALQGGGDLRSPLAKLIGIGDVEGAKAIGEYANQQATQQYRQQSLTEDTRHHKATEDLTAQAHREGKIPFGWNVQPGGGAATFIPGGPADPKYIADATESKAKPREMSITDITKLSDEGGKFGAITGFQDTFKPEFAGYGVGPAGSAALYMGRNFPEYVPENTAKAAQWWQGYDKFKNVVRNELFGASLTLPEKAAFEQADITPGMAPKTIEANLKVQHEVAQNGLKRKADAMIQAGYDPKVIAKAYGIKLEDVGVTATPSRKGQDRTPNNVPTSAAIGGAVPPRAEMPAQPKLDVYKSRADVARAIQSKKLQSGDSFLDEQGRERVVP